MQVAEPDAAPDGSLSVGAGGVRSVDRLEPTIHQWQRIEAALSPVIGHRGVAALFRRSLFLAAQAHPWLAFPQEGQVPTLDIDALHRVLSARPGAEAAAGAKALLANFTATLDSLVGASLARRLLRSTAAESTDDPPDTLLTP